MYYRVLLYVGVKREANNKTMVSSNVCTIALLAVGVKREANKTVMNSDVPHYLE
jgi:hypothetical protein